MWAIKPVLEMSVKIRCSCGCVGVCSLRQTKVDILSFAVYAGGKKTSVWTVWPVQATTDKRKCLLRTSKLVRAMKMNRWTSKSQWYAPIITHVCT